MLREILTERFENIHRASRALDILPPQLYRWCDPDPAKRTIPSVRSLQKLAAKLDIPLIELVQAIDDYQEQP